MLRVLVIFQLLLAGCGNIGLSAWDETSTLCPESDYDNGGNVEPQVGYCKSGRGFFVSYEHKIN
jgi:hypothetical protein